MRFNGIDIEDTRFSNLNGIFVQQAGTFNGRPVYRHKVSTHELSWPNYPGTSKHIVYVKYFNRPQSVSTIQIYIVDFITNPN